MDYELALSKIAAPSPQNPKKFCDLRIHEGAVESVAASGRRTKIFEMFYNVCGILPPVNNIGFHESGSTFPDHWGGLKHSIALFKGIKRPFMDDGLDCEIFVYVLKPRYVYEFIPDMVCAAKRNDAPEDAVFAVYAKFDNEYYTNGAILSWEWIPADNANSELPEGHADRYEERVW
jgi:hypothetical protein